MTTPSLDWLDDEPPAKKPKKTTQALARLKERKTLERTSKREELVTLFKQLPWEQRLWLRALADNGFNTRAARKALKDRKLHAPAQYTSARWGRVNPAYIKARELLAELLYEGEAPSRAALLLRLNEIAEYNVEEVDEFHQGEPTGRKQMRDVGAALKATEMQGKHLKMFGEDKGGAPEGPQLVVQIISKDDPTRVVDVTPGRVTVSPAAPAIEGECEEVPE